MKGYPMVDTLNGYQAEATKFARYNPMRGIEYNALKLASEAGEVCGKIAKWSGHGVNAKGVGDELGDVLWHLSELAKCYGYTLQEIANRNLDKLAGRAERGTIVGNGDHR